MNGVEPVTKKIAEVSKQKIAFINHALCRKLREAALVLTLLILSGLAGYITYRHWILSKNHPSISRHPARLATPLSEEDLLGLPVRWVEIEVTPAPNSSVPASMYRDTLESPGSLILAFKAPPKNAGRKRYRGILQTYRTRRTGYRFPKFLSEELAKNQIVPNQKFAILWVEESMWGPGLKERLAIASGVCLCLFLVIHLIRALIALLMPIRRTQWIEVSDIRGTKAWPDLCFRCGSTVGPDCIQARVGNRLSLPLCDRCNRKRSRLLSSLLVLAIATATIAITWSLYRSVRYGPVLLSESIIGLGISTLLGIVVTLSRLRPIRLRPLIVRSALGSRKKIKSVLVHKKFLTVISERCT